MTEPPRRLPVGAILAGMVTLLGIAVLAGSGMCLVASPVGWIGMAAAALILVVGRAISESYRDRLARQITETAPPSSKIYWAAATSAGTGWLLLMAAGLAMALDLKTMITHGLNRVPLNSVFVYLAMLGGGCALVWLGRLLSRKPGKAPPLSPSQN
jgi:hypothetical protein